MQIMITHGSMARTRVLRFSRLELASLAALLAFLLVIFSGAVYHWLFLKATREGWPIVSTVVRLVVRDEIAQRDRFMRDNLDAIAQRVGEVQAKLVKLEAVGERVVGMAGVKPEELKPLQRSPAPSPGAAGGGQGGVYLPLVNPSLEELGSLVNRLDEAAEQQSDLFTLAESRLFEARMRALMIPSAPPVLGPVGSGFGFRPDPFTGRMALHSGLDFPAEVGTPIQAAAGGVVVDVSWHPQFSQMLEIEHGSTPGQRLSTLYAHLSRVMVKEGDLVRRGQVIAQVGNTGRSTGPHLHFEVLLEGVPQDPMRFLQRGQALADSRQGAGAQAAPRASR